MICIDYHTVERSAVRNICREHIVKLMVVLVLTAEKIIKLKLQ